MVLRPRHGHVDQPPQFLVLRLERGSLRRIGLSDVGNGMADVEPPLVLGVEDRRCAGPRFFLPAVDDQHAGKLEPLGRMHRHDRDGIFVALDPPAHQLTLFVLGRQFAKPLEHDAGMAARATAGVVEQLHDVGEVDDPPLAARGRCHPGRQFRVRHDLGGDRRDALSLQGRVQPGDRLLDRLLGRLAERADVGERLAEKRCRRRPPGTAEITRPHHRLQDDADVVGHLAVHHAGRPAAHRGDAERHELLLDLPAHGIHPHQHADLAGLDGTRLGRIEPACREEFVDSADGGRRQRRPAGVQELDRLQPHEPRRVVPRGGGDLLVDDARPELGGVERRVERGEQRPVGAMIFGECSAGRSVARFGHAPLRKTQVGGDVGPTESVDRLLRIADSDQRPVSLWREDLVEKLPLQPARVLRLVHDRQPVFLAEQVAERRRLVPFHLLPGPPQEVVEAGCRPHPLVHLGDAVSDELHRPGQRQLLVGRAASRVEPRHEERIAEMLFHEFLQRFLIPDPWLCRHRLGDDRIVDDLGDDAVPQVLVTRLGGHDPRQPQHPRADGVDRADRGRVELRDRPLEPTGLREPVAGVEEQLVVELVGGVAGGLLAAEQQGGGHHPAADAVAQLRGRVSRVGRDEDRADPHALVGGDRLRDDRRDGIGLPRAGAGLDERAVGKQAFRESEGCGHVRVYFTPLLVSLRRAMKRSRNASSRDAGAKICPKPGLSP